MKHKIFFIISVLTPFLVAAIFVMSAVITASDAQGAIIFIFSLPVLAVLLFLGHFLSHKRSPIRTIIFLETIFLILFVTSAFVPSFNFFSQSIVSGISKGFEHVTGMTPYEWGRQSSQE